MDDLLSRHPRLKPWNPRAWLEHADPCIRRNRIQAFHCFPALVGALIASPSRGLHSSIVSLIDNGAPFIDELSRLAKVRKSSIRITRQLNPDNFDCRFIDIAQLLRVIDALPNGVQPHNDDDWRLFDLTWRMIASVGLFDTAAVASQQDLGKHLVSGITRAGSKRIRRMFGGRVENLQTLIDYLSYFENWCALGAGEIKPNAYVQNAIRRRISNELLMRYSALEIVRQASLWHRNKLEVLGINDPAHQSLLWPALPDLPWRHGSCTLVPLMSRDELIIEGMHLMHCVGEYWPKCFLGETHIISVRDACNQSISTVEITLQFGADNRILPILVQHNGFHNDSPLPEAEAAVASYIYRLEATDIQTQLSVLVSHHKEKYEEKSNQLGLDEISIPIQDPVDIMWFVLPDHDQAVDYLLARLQEEDTWYQIANSKAEAQLSRYGFGDDLSYDRAWEIYRTTGDEACLDAGLSAI